MRYGSTFTGIGGFDLAFDKAGMTPAWQVEIDAKCGDLLQRHWPYTERHTDIKETHDLPGVDLICGGFPCQDLSVAGRRAGLAGERSGLFYEFARLVEEQSPRWVVLENVPGLLSSNAGADMGAVLGTLAELGYGFAYRVLDAQYFGVAQRRRRVFIVGCLGDSRSAIEVLLEPEGVRRDSPPSRQEGPKAAHGLRASAGSRGTDDPDRSTYDDVGGAVEEKRSIVAATVKSGGNDGGFRTEPGEHLVVEPLARCDTTGERYDGDTETFVPIAFSHNQGLDIQPSTSARPTLRVGGGGSAVATFDPRNITSRLNRSRVEPGRPAGTLHEQPQNVIGPFGVRRLTPVECERLQGFPDGWTDGQADSTRYRQLGNAVCVPVVQWIGERIMQIEECGSVAA